MMVAGADNVVISINIVKFTRFKVTSLDVEFVEIIRVLTGILVQLSGNLTAIFVNILEF